VGLSVCLRFPTSGLGPMLSADDSRPGPASARSAWAIPCGLAHTDGCPRSISRPLTQNGVAERFPDWTAVGFRAGRTPRSPACANERQRMASRTLFLGSHVLRGHSWPTCDTLGPTHRWSQNSLLRRDASLAAVLTRSACRALLRPISSGWPDRWSPTSALPAFSCFAGPSLQRSRSHLREPFSCFANQKWIFYY